jgi:hypothetical protein
MPSATTAVEGSGTMLANSPSNWADSSSAGTGPVAPNGLYG